MGQSIGNYRLRRMWNIILPISILCHKIQSLRTSDAWVNDIETLEPAMSNRIETYAFPTKIGLDSRENKYVIRDVSNSNKGISFQPLYFKFRNKFQGNKEIAQDRSSQMNHKYWIQGPLKTPSMSYVLPPRNLKDSRPVIDKRLLYHQVPQMPGPPYTPYDLVPDNIPAPSTHEADPASYDHEIDPVYDVEDGAAEDDNVIVIHEHHHHHHHNTDEESEEGLDQDEMSSRESIQDTEPTEHILNNIMNDEILYDFVTFLMSEAASNQNPEPEVKADDINIFEHSSRTSNDEYAETSDLEDRIIIYPRHDIESFIADGYTPVIEVELDR